jgi:subtilase family serine protease
LASTTTVVTSREVPMPRITPAPLRRLLVALASLVALAVGPAIPAAAVTAGQVAPALGVSPHYRPAGKPSTKNAQVLFTCQQPTAAVPCYGPAQIRAAYRFQPLLDHGITGQGRTIVIVDAFQSPTITQDLALFDQVFGLPDPTFNIIAPDGLTPFDPNDANQVGWSAEISLDVEWAHAIAPNATIDLVLAKSNQDADILSATRYAVDHNLGDVISQSFGEAEQCMDPTLLRQQHQLFTQATLKHITLLASSGDHGAAQPACDGSGFIKAASTPASDPLVTGVGGTRLTADLETGAYQSETAWNDEFGASGGGFSTVYGTPLYQRPLHLPSRGVPDVAYNGDVFGGVLVAWGVPAGVGSFYIFGGTSAGSPQWAGLAALADQLGHRRLGLLNPGIYAIAFSPAYHAAFHDVTTGNNTFEGITGFEAGPGWDAVTGWGTPKADHLVPLLAAGL